MALFSKNDYGLSKKGPLSRAEGIPYGKKLGEALNEYGTGKTLKLLQMMYIQREQVSRIYRRTRYKDQTRNTMVCFCKTPHRKRRKSTIYNAWLMENEC